ncbi:MAG TPA: hypothetical protein VN685_01535 [Rhizomicrobium sp.]|nr:hypothetical protein [Rhizomicrobium sp.]
MTKKRIAAGTIALGFLSTAAAFAADSAYPNMAPAAQYMMASPAAEIALARSAAPPSISRDADVLVLGAHGYETAVKGKNGFVCLVERSWNADFKDPLFWDQNIRGADCLNPEAARAMLPHYRERANWALAGVSKAEMLARTNAEIAAHTYVLPEPGAMSFMLSKDQRLGAQSNHWHPHLMFFVANMKDAAWGANFADSPVLLGVSGSDPIKIFLVPVGKWSDGTPADGMDMK